MSDKGPFRHLPLSVFLGFFRVGSFPSSRLPTGAKSRDFGGLLARAPTCMLQFAPPASASRAGVSARISGRRLPAGAFLLRGATRRRFRARVGRRWRRGVLLRPSDRLGCFRGQGQTLPKALDRVLGDEIELPDFAGFELSAHDGPQDRSGREPQSRRHLRGGVDRVRERAGLRGQRGFVRIITFCDWTFTSC